MYKFQIIQKEPSPYKHHIITFWNEYLPGTPQGRFEWMKHGNPAGPAHWFFAFEERSNDLAGTISILPRDLYYRGKHLRAGILGDFMVSSKYRVFGPALSLPKAVKDNLTSLGLHCIYTLPNDLTKKILVRAGFSELGRLCSLVKPINLTYYLQKRVHRRFARLLAPWVTLALIVLSRDTYTSSQGIFEECTDVDEQFDLLWDHCKATWPGIIGDHSSSYLRWRYVHNPHHTFRVLTYKNAGEKKLRGYCFFTITNHVLEIYDILAYDATAVAKLLKQLTIIATKEKCKSIYINILSDSPYYHQLKSFLFFDIKAYANIFYTSRDTLPTGVWSFFSGDRNI